MRGKSIGFVVLVSASLLAGVVATGDWEGRSGMMEFDIEFR